MSLRDAFVEAVDDGVVFGTVVGDLDQPVPCIVSVAESLEMFATSLEDTGVPAYVNLARELRGE